jgi:hypothetical protein
MSHPPTEPDSTAEPRRRVQFSLRALLWFVAAWSAFLSLLAASARIQAQQTDEYGMLLVFPGWQGWFIARY